MKRILSLDGGGVRSFFTLQVLERVENILRERTRNPEYRLGEHFDLIAGTSAGAIIGSLLAWGMSVAEVKRHYATCVQAVFQPAPFSKRYKYKYTDAMIAAELQSLFQEEDGRDALFGSQRLHTLLLIVLRNATTGSPWPLCNNPKAKYNDQLLTDCNLNLPLWQLVRASSAAPTYFPCEKIRVGQQTFEFIDGGISPYNNPSFLAYQFATLPSYRIGWITGVDKLYLLSVGVGQARAKIVRASHRDMYLFDHASHVISSLMHSSSMQQDLACRTVARTLHGAPIDLELGDMINPNYPNDPKFQYVRYDVDLAEKNLAPREIAKTKNTGYSLDNLDLIPFFVKVGREYADENVKSESVR